RRLADLEQAGALRPTQASLAKLHNTRTARRVAQVARDLLGGNGILLDYGVIQHMADIEAIHTYEGTESIQALLLGRDITGHGASAGRGPDRRRPPASVAAAAAVRVAHHEADVADAVVALDRLRRPNDAGLGGLRRGGAGGALRADRGGCRQLARVR